MTITPGYTKFRTDPGSKLSADSLAAIHETFFPGIGAPLPDGFESWNHDAQVLWAQQSAGDGSYFSATLIHSGAMASDPAAFPVGALVADAALELSKWYSGAGKALASNARRLLSGVEFLDKYFVSQSVLDEPEFELRQTGFFVVSHWDARGELASSTTMQLTMELTLTESQYVQIYNQSLPLAPEVGTTYVALFE